MASSSCMLVLRKCVSHFYFAHYNPISAQPKTLAGVWHVTDTIFNSTACISVSKINLMVLWYHCDTVTHPLWCISETWFPLHKKGYCLRFSQYFKLHIKNYIYMKVSCKAKSKNPILALKKILNGGWFWPSFSLLSNQQHGRTHEANLYQHHLKGTLHISRLYPVYWSTKVLLYSALQWSALDTNICHKPVAM